MITFFRSGHRYRHKNNLDVDIFVVKAFYITPLRCKLKVIYINRNWQNGNFIIDATPEKADFYPNNFMWSRIS